MGKTIRVSTQGSVSFVRRKGVKLSCPLSDKRYHTLFIFMY